MAVKFTNATGRANASSALASLVRNGPRHLWTPGQAVPTLGVDVSDTFVQEKRHLVNEINRMFGLNLTTEDVISPNIEECLRPHGVTISTAEVKAILKKLWENPTEIKLLDPKVPAILQRLCTDFRVAITTAADATYEGLQLCFEHHGIPYHELYQVKSAEDKLQLPVDIHIDDHPTVIEMAVDAGRKAVVIKQHWNRNLRVGLSKELVRGRWKGVGVCRFEDLETVLRFELQR